MQWDPGSQATEGVVQSGGCREGHGERGDTMEVDLRARLISGFSGRQISAGGEQVNSEFGKGHWGPEVADCRDYQGRGTHTP